MAESRVHNQFKLTSEDHVEVKVGEEVTLPCHISPDTSHLTPVLTPDTSAVATTIRWFKGTECIYMYKNGQVTERSGYEGRVSLITQKLKRGNVSLRLRDFRWSDIGVYICQVIHGEQKDEAAVSLLVREVSAKPKHEAKLLGLAPYEVQHERFDSGSRYLQRETQEDKLKREASAGELELKMEKELKEKLRQEMMKQLKEKDTQLDDMTQEVREKDRQLDDMTQEVREKDTQLDDMTQEVREKERLLEEKNQIMEQREKLLEEKENQLEEKDKQLKDRDIQLEDRNHRLGEKDRLLEERVKQLKDRDIQLEDRNHRLGEKDRLLKEREKLLEGKEK
ncbi:golgin subfamily A member 6-like protein 22 isoform X2 [Oncorhynchus mykiss]|uniref:golgin subfamily A member 6-like protein 22 isoform X2 n=1 Tax=Oncorhynchus mykiss TaxID=8022 RepID=UPI001877EE7D|nr:golgin subfamily A member 6-like protein 22 isoform X2 [Oncorhynchus mykiss]